MPIQPARLSTAAGDSTLAESGAPIPLDLLVPPDAAGSPREPWEVEIGFGKGRYLLERCRNEPGRRFLGIEIAGQYLREWVRRSRKLGLKNFLVLHGDALALLATSLPAGFAEVVHVYFPDPWPKTRHKKRRLLDPETVDLVLRLLAPGGKLSFATDFLEYGEKVVKILSGVPGLEIRRIAEWPEGPRTHYEAKFVAEGRPIVRLEAWFAEGAGGGLHPLGERGVVAAVRGFGGEEEDNDE
ncbi:MAG TPA: tRNA (guanosine(46)-N7)-methyltransferase TrmB [Thermoanaerobaculia bacterium]|jgi:tRNA (guanine-N7-)-methyltransferase|nr:tRNA (guanosine(46)-N7)-methyltransferase TrmB [Thermoanaerobaculia bacterium]